jgi:hypothetical protein
VTFVALAVYHVKLFFNLASVWIYDIWAKKPCFPFRRANCFIIWQLRFCHNWKVAKFTKFFSIFLTLCWACCSLRKSDWTTLKSRFTSGRASLANCDMENCLRGSWEGECAGNWPHSKVLTQPWTIWGSTRRCSHRANDKTAGICKKELRQKFLLDYRPLNSHYSRVPLFL